MEKDTIIKLRIRAEEKANLQKRASEKGVTLSQYIRWIASLTVEEPDQ